MSAWWNSDDPVVVGVSLLVAFAVVIGLTWIVAGRRNRR